MEVPTTSGTTEGPPTETTAAGVQTNNHSTMIGIAPNATTRTSRGGRSAIAVRRLALKATGDSKVDSNAETTAETTEEADSNAAMTAETDGPKGETTTRTTGHALHATTQISRSETSATGAKQLALRAVAIEGVATTEAVTNVEMTVVKGDIATTNETINPETGVSRTAISTPTIGPVLHATTQISRSETPATDVRHLALEAVVVAVAATEEAEVAATETDETSVGTIEVVASNAETTVPTAVKTGHSEETTEVVASNAETTVPTVVKTGHSEETTEVVVASNAETTDARLPTGLTGDQEENDLATHTTNLPVTSGTAPHHGDMSEKQTNEAVP